MQSVEIFGFDIVRKFFERHRNHLEAGKQIRAEALKIPAGDPTQFTRRRFVGEGNLQVAPRQTAIFGKHRPGAKAEEISDCEQSAHGKRARDGGAGAIQKINAEVEHAGAASRRIRAEA